MTPTRQSAGPIAFLFVKLMPPERLSPMPASVIGDPSPLYKLGHMAQEHRAPDFDVYPGATPRPFQARGVVSSAQCNALARPGAQTTSWRPERPHRT